MVEAAQVTQVGIYSTDILNAAHGSSKWALAGSSAPMSMLRALVSSPEACAALRRLDLVLEEMSPDCFELLRRNVNALRTLVIRRAFRLDRLSHIWNPDETYWWCPSPNLTRLVLIGCQRPGAKHMVGLVACFPALRELVWASCGTSKEPTPALPKAGWSQDLQAWSSRPTLQLLHIEHALQWELSWMGLISADTVVVAHFDENRLVRALDRTVEIFLGMEKLRVLPRRDILGIDAAYQQPPEGRTLDAICEERRVSLSRDASLLKPNKIRRWCCGKCLRG